MNLTNVKSLLLTSHVIFVFILDVPDKCRIYAMNFTNQS